jgi:ribokinase
MNALVVGSANTDLVIQVGRLPDEGNTVVGSGFRSGPGGKGANQAVCLARLGVHTSLVARFGKDEFSRVLRQEISRLGVDLSSAIIDTGRNGGIAFIILDGRGNNTMVVDLGSNLFLDSKDVEGSYGLFENSDLLLLQLEVSDEANIAAASMARNHGLKVVLNPAPMRPFDGSILEKADIITPNMQELESLLRHLKGDSPIRFDETDPEKVADAARGLFAFGGCEVVVTLGERGSLLVREKDAVLFNSYRVQQVDATAAGDAFTAALAYRYACGNEIQDCIPFASAAAACVIQRAGAVYSLPRLEEVENFEKKNTMSDPLYFT